MRQCIYYSIKTDSFKLIVYSAYSIKTHGRSVLVAIPARQQDQFT